MPDYFNTLDFDPPRRVHIRDPHEWANSPGTDFWANFGLDDLAAGGGRDLADRGWETAGFGILEGAGAGILDSANKGAIGGINMNGVGDYIISPTMFGDYEHGLAVKRILGYFPTKIIFECYARFVAGADEEATGFGWLQDGTDANALVKADTMAFITIDGTDFSLESSAGADTGLTKATTPHLFKVVGNYGAAFDWFVDGASQGTLAAVANQAPLCWGAGTKAASGTNKPIISWVHIWYE